MTDHSKIGRNNNRRGYVMEVAVADRLGGTRLKKASGLADVETTTCPCCNNMVENRGDDFIAIEVKSHQTTPPPQWITEPIAQAERHGEAYSKQRVPQYPELATVHCFKDEGRWRYFLIKEL